MRLIDADKFMIIIRQHNYPLSDRIGSRDYGMFTTGIQQAIDECETIDAAPVVHGKWEPEGDGIVKCSVCGGSFVVEDDEGWTYEPTNYCGDCGAKMDADDVSNE